MGRVRLLGVEQRDRQWVSSLTGARFRWTDDDGWQWRGGGEEWSTAWSSQRIGSVLAYPGEVFQEVSDEQ